MVGVDEAQSVQCATLLVRAAGRAVFRKVRLEQLQALLVVPLVNHTDTGRGGKLCLEVTEQV